jgi:hypothetical protein
MKDEMTVAELERMMASAHTGRDLARERRENAEAMKLCDELEDHDKERAADLVDEALAGWKDPLTGLPFEGMESPRFRTAREREYMNWVGSEAGARTRAIVHPGLEERLRRRDAEAGR